MSYRDKETERRDADLFIAARESAIGEKLTIVGSSEAPDFLCQKSDGSIIGLELTRIEYNPEYHEDMKDVPGYDAWLDNFAVLWAASIAIAKKEAKRARSHWQHAEATILVLDLIYGYRFEEWPGNDEYSDELAETGFIEVWLSDHSPVSDFGEVAVIGLYPKSLWGTSN